MNDKYTFVGADVLSQYKVETQKYKELRGQLTILKNTVPNLKSIVNFKSFEKQEMKGKIICFFPFFSSFF